MEHIKKNFHSVIVCIFEVLVGILLLIEPVRFATGIMVSAGVLLMLVGIGYIIKYFCTEVIKASVERMLLKGMILLLAGGFLVMKYQWLLTVLPLTTVIYGMALLLIGLNKIQWTADMLRGGAQKWYLPAISAAASIICAAIILKNPFSSVNVLWIFTGIALIVEAFFDTISIFMDDREVGSLNLKVEKEL